MVVENVNSDIIIDTCIIISIIIGKSARLWHYRLQMAGL